MEHNNLIRSKNYSNLDDCTHDEQNHRLNVSAFSNEALGMTIDELEICRYVNVDTQTSFEYEPCDIQNDDIYDDEEQVDEENAQHLSNDANDQVDQETNLEQAEYHQSDGERVSRPIAGDRQEAMSNEIYNAGDSFDKERQLNILREILAIERQRNEKRRHNSSAMQRYLQQMQTEYLRIQRDLVEALELGHKIKAQKEAQLEAISETVKEKDGLIQKLKTNLESLDEAKLRKEFNTLLAKQTQLAKMEKQQLKDQMDIVEQQLIRERATHSQTLEKLQVNFDGQLKSNELEIESARKKLTSLELELNKVLGEPQNSIIRELKEEKSHLIEQVEVLNLNLDENQAKYELLRKRVDSLLREQEQIERASQDEINKLHDQHVNQRKALNEAKTELEDKQEAVQLLQFDLQRSEKRVKSLLEVLKGKEETFKEMIGQLEIKHEQELDKSLVSLRIAERKVIECEGKLDKKQGELIKLEFDLENQLETLRNDRDQRINKLEHQNAERELRAAEIELARQVEYKKQKSELIEQFQKEASQFREEGKRLSIELTKCEMRLSSKQQELNQVLEEKKLLERQQDQAIRKNQSYELEEIRRHCERLEATVEELKVDNEKLSIKLRLSESSLSKTNAAINKEHAKMVHNYERKLEQIRVERSNYVRSELRYRKYGYKLKKYCDHMRRVHEHLCNPEVCGYTITGSTRSSQVNQSMRLKPDGTYQIEEDSLLNKRSDSFSSDEEGDLLQQPAIQTELNASRKQNLFCSTPLSGQKGQQRRHDKFTIKRTGSRSKPIETCH